MRIWQSIIILAFIKVAWAQPAFEDSLRNALTHAENDSSRIVLLSELAYYFSFNRLDSSIYYARKMISYSQETGNKYGEALGFLQLSNALGRVGDYPKSLEMALKGRTLAGDLKNNKVYLLRKTLVQLALLDRLTNQYRSGLVHLFEALRLSEEAGKSGDDYFQIYSNLGFCYGGLGQIDSALIYTQQGNELAIQSNDENGQLFVLYALGRTHVLANRIDLAEIYIKQGIELSNRNNRLFFWVGFSNQLAELYKRSGKLDSCLLLAKKAFDLSQQYQYGIFLRTASRILTETYEALHQPDSTLKYMRLMLAANDSIFGQESVRQFQHLGFDEEQRKQQARAAELKYQNKMRLYILASVLGLFLVLAFFLYQKNKQKEKVNTLLQNQKDEIAQKNSSLEQTLAQLKTTQAQLIQSEKMASLGELTAGIAHEIQNPLNFVNNFSEVNTELLAEMKAELNTGNIRDALSIFSAIEENEQKINFHGQRADNIVKGMLQHSRKGAGVKEPTDLNVLCDDYLRLAYHGYKAKDKTFNADFETHFDPALPKVNVIPQDFGRVILNIINNAFYALSSSDSKDKAALSSGSLPKEDSSFSEAMEDASFAKATEDKTMPRVTITTKYFDSNSGHKTNSSAYPYIQINISDNGPGVPPHLKDKIFQPFFTTKPSGSGTGLGLSLAYEIVTNGHGGELILESEEGKGSTFIIRLPVEGNL